MGITRIIRTTVSIMNTENLFTFASIGQCAGATGFSEKQLKAWKKKGADGFNTAGRIHLGPLLRWVNSHTEAGDAVRFEVEHALRERAERIKAEVEASEATRNSIPISDAEAIFNRALLPVRQCLLALPTLAPSCNPSDPEHAKAHLESYVDQSLKLCREFNLKEQE